MVNFNRKKLELWLFAVMAVLAVLAVSYPAAALTITPVGSDGGPITEFYYTIQEDQTFDVEAGVQTGDSLGVRFYNSHSPVAFTGDETTADVAVDAGTRYFVTVLPKSGYSLGAAPVPAGQDTVTITCNQLPLDTAQISVYVFEDNHPCNNAHDLPEETGLEGFTVILYDAGGKYGMSGGRVMSDAYGNMLGTEYLTDANGQLILDGEGQPQITHMGQMFYTTDAEGRAQLKHLTPAKYGVVVIPPGGTDWQQTSTLEGTPVIDAWVKPGEPPYFQEFGPPGFHAAFGFVHPTNNTAALTGSSTINGQVVNLHTSRPPQTQFWTGQPLGGIWVGLNDPSGALIWAQPADPDLATFSIPNVPAGSYQLVFWDKYLDNIFAFHNVVVDGTQPVIDLGEIPVFQWFGHLTNVVYYDANENGLRDAGEMPMAEQLANIRWRDGTMYQSMATDMMGEAPFEEVFPFFNWLVAEVDYGRYKPTGVTVVVDNGGEINAADPWSYGGVLNPQPQPDNGNAPYRVETGPALTEPFQVFLGQTNVLEWGKVAYGPGENGGISGIVFYSTTRAENDPRFGLGEPWEPGIPRVQMALYADGDVDVAPLGDFPGVGDIDWNNNGALDLPDGVIDDVDGDLAVTLADEDNYPLGWSSGGAMGPEDVDHNTNGTFDSGDAIQIAVTDSWDDTPPTGCVGDPFVAHGVPTDCFDGLRNFNQARPGVFDGGYWFNSYFPGGWDSGSTVVDGLPNTTYIVQAAIPAGYKLVKEEDKNVDFGDVFETQAVLINIPFCVGDPHVVPAELSLFPGIPTASAGLSKPLCDRKQVRVVAGRNAPADFFMFTEAPVAAQVVGFVLDDTANEWDPNAPTFGEKFAPSWVPVSFRDFSGQEVNRVYTDEWGAYNALLPSTYTVNIGNPSGMSPNMLTACINSAFMPDPLNPGQTIEDPYYNPQYSTFCYTFQYMPGTTTFLDTPVMPTAAHTGANQFPLDCEFPDQTPVIAQVDSVDGGPYLSTPIGGGGKIITITSMGDTQVKNPAWDGAGGVNPINITRDYGFGAVEGTVTLAGVPLAIDSWAADTITAVVPAGAATGQLIVTRGDNDRSTLVGLTLTIGGTVHRVASGESIQTAIDAANPGDLVLVGPGQYRELVILYKDVQLQGWGAGVTSINAVKEPTEKLELWRAKVEALYDAGEFDILPGQTLTGEFAEFSLFNTEEGPGILVVGKAGGFSQARIDGFTLTGADFGGAIFVNGYAENLVITNNRIQGNQGFYGGGIRLGHPNLILDNQFVDAQNDNIRIEHNHIKENGGLAESGGGISICTGADGYYITDNYVCGNFTMGYGAGIGHTGRSDGGSMFKNVIIFNKNFNQGVSADGGGISIRGNPGLVGGLSEGTGSVSIVSNQIQGNLAGSGDGGGIYLGMINGQDVGAGGPGTYQINLFNNIIVNNIAAFAGGGLSLFDAINVNIINNTIAHNDSTATASGAFGAGPTVSTPQVAGIVSRGLSTGLWAAIGRTAPTEAYVLPQPVLLNNIVWKNRSFYFDTAANGGLGGLVPDVSTDPAVFNDLGVIGFPAGSRLNPRFCILTDVTGYDGSNLQVDPNFVAGYFNGPREKIIIPEATTGIQVTAAFDEGGNFIDLRFGPLSPIGDYRLPSGGPAVDAGTNTPIAQFPDLAWDISGQARPFNGVADIGADEYSNAAGGGGTVTPTSSSANSSSSGGSSGGGGCFIGTFED
jgi:hypothetical protein